MLSQCSHITHTLANSKLAVYALSQPRRLSIPERGKNQQCGRARTEISYRTENKNKCLHVSLNPSLSLEKHSPTSAMREIVC